MKKRILISILSLIAVCITATAFAYHIKGLEKEVDAIDMRINGRHYVLLTDICRAHGIEWEWDSVSRKIFLRKDGQEAALLVGSRYYYDGTKTKKLDLPIRMKSGSIWVPVRFARYTVRRLFESGRKPSRISTTKPVTRTKRAEAKKPSVKKPSAKKFKIKKVVIDPGHGGKDPGAIGRTGLYEKHVVLDVCKRIKKELEKNGIDVIMTRNSDRFISLGGRTKFANKNDTDLFISIHANANRRRWMRGFEVYTLSEATDDNARALAAAENSVLEYEAEAFGGRHTKDGDAIVWDLMLSEYREESIELAGLICHEVGKRAKLKKNNIKTARFYVLKDAEMPAVLVELSYLSNKWDEKNLKKSSYKQKLAEGIANGILAFKYEYERKNGFSQ